MKSFEVDFPGGKRVDAHYDGRTIQTDQSVEHGGDGSAPEPFDLFFASMATCVGIYVLEFCTSRNLSTEGLAVRLDAERDPERKIFSPIRITVTLPKDFPDNYEAAIRRAADLCTVKRHIVAQPEFEIVTEAAG